MLAKIDEMKKSEQKKSLADAIQGTKLSLLFWVLAIGAIAAHIKCTAEQAWNGDEHAQSDEFAAGETSPDGFWSLDASGSVLRFLDAGITGNVVANLAATMVRNNCGTALSIHQSLSGGLYLQFRDAATGAYLDVTTLVDTGSITFLVLYMTSE